ncbi:snare-dependent exocytosis protein-like protein, partial [Aureobasidium melanogenum]
MFDQPRNSTPLLPTHKLTNIIRPPLTIAFQILHRVAHDVEFLCAFLDLALHAGRREEASRAASSARDCASMRFEGGRSGPPTLREEMLVGVLLGREKGRKYLGYPCLLVLRIAFLPPIGSLRFDFGLQEFGQLLLYTLCSFGQDTYRSWPVPHMLISAISEGPVQPNMSPLGTMMESANRLVSIICDMLIELSSFNAGKLSKVLSTRTPSVFTPLRRLATASGVADAGLPVWASTDNTVTSTAVRDELEGCQSTQISTSMQFRDPLWFISWMTALVTQCAEFVTLAKLCSRAKVDNGRATHINDSKFASFRSSSHEANLADLNCSDRSALQVKQGRFPPADRGKSRPKFRLWPQRKTATSPLLVPAANSPLALAREVLVMSTPSIPRHHDLRPTT